MRFMRWGAFALTSALLGAGCAPADSGGSEGDAGVGGGAAGGAGGSGGQSVGGGLSGGAGGENLGGSGGQSAGGAGGLPVGGAGGEPVGGNGGEPVGGAGGQPVGGNGGEPVGGNGGEPVGGAGGEAVGGAGGELIGGAGGEPVGGAGGEPVGGAGGEPGDPCALVECAEGLTCDPATGECVAVAGPPSCEETCAYLADCLGVAPEDAAGCVVECEADPAVERRACVLASGCDQAALEACFADAGPGDPCLDVVCPEGQVCDPTSGACVGDVPAPPCDELCQQYIDCGFNPADSLPGCVSTCEADATPALRVCSAAAGCDLDAQTACFSAEDPCFNVVCIPGMQCNPDTGECELAPACEDDALEENDVTRRAAPVEPGVYTDLQICAGDLDYYALAVGAGCSAAVSVAFIHRDGDIDLSIEDPGAVTSDVSNGSGDGEEVTLTAGADTTMIILVYGYAGAINTYDLSIQVACP